MDASEWGRVCGILDPALELEPGERKAFVERACTGDAELLRMVEAYIDAFGCEERFPAAPPTSTKAPEQTGDTGKWVGARVGAYRLLDEIGRGGTGRVYLAERADGGFEKRVAIKVLESVAAGDFFVRRFEVERQILAQLEHSYIVRLLDGGTTEDGLPYLVMEYVEGLPIDRHCDEQGLGVKARLWLFLKVCEAVEYAHRNLVVHRDIKPGNILVTQSGEARLLDFGIARLLAPDLFGRPFEPTLTGGWALTPRYASPEQVRAEHITVATDVYSLGVLLYELLSGQRPYGREGEPPHELMRAVCEAEPAPPSRAAQAGGGEGGMSPRAVARARGTTVRVLTWQLEGDLDQVVLKTLAKEPGRRYASVEKLGDDIRRHLDGLPVLAHQGTFAYQVGKFMRRNRLAVLTGTAVILSVVGAVAGLIYGGWQARLGEIRALNALVELRLASNQQLEALIDAIRSAHILRQTPGVPEQLTLETLAALQQSAGIEESNRLQHGAGMAMAVNFSADGSSVVTASSDGVVRLWTKAGALVHKLVGHTSWVTDVRFSPDGRFLASASRDGSIRLWSTRGTPMRTLRGHTGRVRALTFSPDGKTLASAAWDRTVRLWRTDGTPLAVLKGHRDGVLSVDFAPDGRTLVSSGADGTICLWKPDGRLLKMVTAHQGKAPEVRFSPDGRTLASVGYDGLVRLWRAGLVPLRSLRGHIGEIYAVKFAPDGKTLATGGLDKSVRLWTIEGEPVAVFRGHKSEIYGLAFAPDRKTLASASADGTVRFWRYQNPLLRVLTAHTDQVEQVVFSPDGETLATAGFDGALRLWRDGLPTRVLIGSGAAVKAVAFAPDGKTLASANLDNTTRLWRTDGRALLTIPGPPMPPPGGGFVGGVAFSADGKTLATANPDSTLRLWTREGKPLRVLTAPAVEGGLRRVVFSPDGTMLTSAGNDSTIRLWSMSGRRLSALSGNQGWVSEVKFASDGRTLASIGTDGSARLWEITGRALAHWTADPTHGYSLALAPNGKWLATAGTDGTVRFWDRSGHLLRILRGHGDIINSIAFSPDARLLAVGDQNGAVRLWDWNYSLDELLVRGCAHLADYQNNSPQLELWGQSVCVVGH